MSRVQKFFVAIFVSLGGVVLLATSFMAIFAIADLVLYATGSIAAGALVFVLPFCIAIAVAVASE